MEIDLHKNEIVTLDNNSNLNKRNFTTDEIEEKYSKGEVRIITEQARYPLNSILALVESDDYILNPEFQRRHRWNTERKSKLMESFIINVPIPPIFLYEIDYSVYEVMDGLQRLTAISQFYSDKFELEGLVEWPELNGMKYSELPTQIRKGIDRRYISSIILLQETAKSQAESNRLKQMVFERINSGGEKLKAQEIRNALYPGIVNNLIMKMSRNPIFCKLWNIPEPDEVEIETAETRKEVIENVLYKDMSDVELCLRFLAYRQIDKWKGNTMEFFLDEYLQTSNTTFNKEVVEHLSNIFNETIQLAYDLFGLKAFYLQRKREDKWILLDKPTKILYDPLMQVLSTLLDKKMILISNKEQIRKDNVNFQKNNYDIFKGRDTNKTKVIKRIKIIEDFLRKYI